jgi:hypothetical protein
MAASLPWLVPVPYLTTEANDEQEERMRKRKSEGQM